MTRPIREPSKPTKRMRFLLARMNNDPRFSDFVDELMELGKMFVATPSMIEAGAQVVGYKLRQKKYAHDQAIHVRPEDEEIDDE